MPPPCCSDLSDGWSGKGGTAMIIDAYTHLAPRSFLTKMDDMSATLRNITRRLLSVKELYDLDARFRAMDAIEDYRQVISLPNPSLEECTSPEVGRELARVANDELAELCANYPSRFAGFVAGISLNDVATALDEVDRTINQLGAVGVQIYTNIDGHPLDDPRFSPFFARMAKHDRPIWLHPTRTAAVRDYQTEAKSRYEMWWCFGWPYDTSVAMARLVFSGLFDRHPDLKIITHHLGGMIPYFDGRVGPGLEVLGSRTTDEDYSSVLSSLKRPHIDYFHMFYADTAMFGSMTALQCGLDFFGSDHVVFATDAPLGPIAKTVDALTGFGLGPDAKAAVFSGNARRLLRLP
jgi:aminocarboxymuconate-semialdehyde decarboxylase